MTELALAYRARAPLFIGFVQAGALLGITFSFLIAAPMVNEVALALLAKGAAPLPRPQAFRWTCRPARLQRFPCNAIRAMPTSSRSAWSTIPLRLQGF